MLTLCHTNNFLDNMSPILKPTLMLFFEATVKHVLLFKQLHNVFLNS
jgi:hypothetical protein